MPDVRTPSPPSRRAPRGAAAVALAAALALGVAPPASAGDRHHRCGPGCQPNCPVRPGHFGFYETQWRRWPGTAPADAGPPAAGTPAAPPRSVVPGADEESPRRSDDELPPPPEPRAGSRDDGRLVAELTTAFEAARAGTEAGQVEFTRRLVSLVLVEPDPAMRAWMVELAAAFATPQSAAICSGALADPDPRVRLVACSACARRIGPAAVPLLAERVRDDADLGVRLRALRSLGAIDADAALVAVAASLDDPDPAVRTRALDVLRRRSGRDFGTDVAAWRAWAADPTARSASAWTDFLRRFF
jgi:hypothetical protein